MPPTDEWKVFLVANGAIDQVTDEAVAGTAAAYGLPVEATLAAYRAAHRGASAGDLLAAIQTDWWERIPALRLADAHAKSPSSTYMYEFAWRSPEFNGLFGACMGSRLPSCSTFSTRGLSQSWGRFWERTLRNSSLMPCTAPGLPSRPVETPAEVRPQSACVSFGNRHDLSPIDCTGGGRVTG